MDKYINSIITSTGNYISELEYLAKDNHKVLNDLFDLQILLKIWDWLDWMEYSELDKIKVEKYINKLIIANPNLEYVVNDFTYYKNVNTSQNIWDWQRVYDNLNIKTINSL